MNALAKRSKTPKTNPETIAKTTAADLAAAADRTRDYFEAADAKNTARAYAGDWRAFSAWCSKSRLDPLDARSVALYVGAIGRDFSPATVARRLAGISAAFRGRGLEAPSRSEAVRRTMKGFRRAAAEEGRTAQERKAPVTGPELRAMFAGIGDSATEARDRAAVLVGFHGAFRRSELVALDVADVVFERAGLRVRIRKSKTDQTGEGREIGILYHANAELCAVRALRAWLDLAGIAEGPILRRIDRHGNIGAGRLSSEGVAIIVKRRAAAAGLDPARFAGHSLRAGLITAAALSGVPERAIANQSGHRSMPMLRRYVRAASVFAESENVGAGLRL